MNDEPTVLGDESTTDLGLRATITIYPDNEAPVTIELTDVDVYRIRETVPPSKRHLPTEWSVMVAGTETTEPLEP